MTLNEKQRLQVAGAFRQAKHVLWDGRGYLPPTDDPFICSTLLVQRTGASRLAVKIIAERMGSLAGSALERWLYVRVGVPQAQIDDAEQMQAYRHRWLAALIEEFSKPEGATRCR